MTPEALSLQNTPIVTIGYTIQVIISLAIVLGMLYVSSKYLIPRFKVGSTGKLIEVMDRIGLEPGVSAYIIKANQKKYLVALSQKNIVLLDSFEEGA